MWLETWKQGQVYWEIRGGGGGGVVVSEAGRIMQALLVAMLGGLFLSWVLEAISRGESGSNMTRFYFENINWVQDMRKPIRRRLSWSRQGWHWLDEKSSKGEKSCSTSSPSYCFPWFWGESPGSSIYPSSASSPGTCVLSVHISAQAADSLCPLRWHWHLSQLKAWNCSEIFLVLVPLEST